MSPRRRARALVVLVVGVLGVALATLSPAMGLGTNLTSVVNANPSNNTPHASNGKVLAIAEVGTRVYVGGSFTTVQNPNRNGSISRNYLFAYERSTGNVVTSFAPRLDGVVESIAPGPNGSIIVGGRFRNVNGTAQRSLAMLDANGTRVSSFSASTNGIVNKVLVRGTRLLAAGRFGRANGATRTNLADFNATTGALGTLNLPVTVGRTKNGAATSASVLEMDANATGTRLVVIGNFRQVGGQQRQQIAMIDLQGNRLAPWFTNRFPNGTTGTDAYPCYQIFDTSMRDVEFSHDGSYFAVVTTGGATNGNRMANGDTHLCDTVTRWETNASVPQTGARETWFNCTGGDTLLSVAVTPAAVYVGGHQRWMDNCGGRDAAVAGSVPRSGIAAVNPSTGRALPWNPGRTKRGHGAEELVTTTAGLYIGSDTDTLGGEFHARLGFFPR